MWKTRLTQSFLKIYAFGITMTLVAPGALNAQGPHGDAVVMTQNQYLGADLAPIITAGTPYQQFAQGVNTWGQSVGTAFYDCGMPKMMVVAPTPAARLLT